jgi:hypothetical protein
LRWRERAKDASDERRQIRLVGERQCAERELGELRLVSLGKCHLAKRADRGQHERPVGSDQLLHDHYQLAHLLVSVAEQLRH